MTNIDSNLLKAFIASQEIGPEEYTDHAKKGEVVYADLIFAPFLQHAERKLDERIDERKRHSVWDNLLAAAQDDYEQWNQRGTLYTGAEDILRRRLALEVTEHDLDEEVLIDVDTFHQGVIQKAFRRSKLEATMKNKASGFDEPAIKFALDELESRLTPAMTCFSGSSAFYFGAVLPYGTKLRTEGLGQGWAEEGLASKEQAIAAARAMQRNSGANYVLAETSNGPSNKIPKSGRKPQTIICTLKGDEEPQVYVHEVDTMLRAHFRATVRELEYLHLHKMYAEQSILIER